MPVIKKYENRRLYDTDASRYVNLEDIAAMVRRGEDVSVVDVKTGRDLTREILLQIVVELQGGAEVLPVAMLRRIIRASGDDPLQKMLKQQIALGLDVLHAQLDQLERQFGKFYPAGGAGPSWGAAGGATGGVAGASSRSPEPPPEEAPSDAPAEAAPGDELDAMRARLAELEQRLKR